MSYRVHSIYRTLQGEGAHSGRPCVILRFAGCNLWSGREEDRPTAVCRFCDTDFVGTDGPEGGKYLTALELVGRVASTWGVGREGRFVVCTGGEPALQLDGILLDTLHRFDFEVAVETNGTRPLPSGLDWVTVSPKAGTDLLVTSGDELKLVYPQPGAGPERYERLDFGRFYLQPMDGPDREANTRAAIRYCSEHPRWRLGLQMHKVVGLP